MNKGHLIVIGGSKGIGKSLVLLAAIEYSAVTVISRSLPESLNDWPLNVYFKSANALVASSLQAAFDEAIITHGRFTAAAFFQRHRGAESAWEGNLASSLTSVRTCIELLKERFILNGDKSIVMLASIATSSVADEQDEGYHAAKAGLLGLCRYYAFKLGPLGFRVNCVSPGALLKENSKHYFLENKQLHDLYCRVTPLRRMGTAEEVAAVVKFLLSAQSSFITGQEITVDGGVGLHWQESLARMLVPID